MIDLTFLTYPFFALVAVFGVTLFTGENVVIEQIAVPHQLDLNGLTTAVATRQFTDELRQLNEKAASEVSGLEVDKTSLQQGLGAFETYFQVTALINGARNVLHLIPFYIEGEIVESQGKEFFTVRVFNQDQTRTVFETAPIEGDPKNLKPMFQKGALAVFEYINPYVVAYYYRKTEADANQFDFKQTQAVADRYLTTQPLEKHYLMYGLLGRMHMIRAEQDKTLSPEQKQSEYDQAMNYLEAALRQRSDFLFPYINIGMIEEERGHNDVAEQYYAHAVELDPNYLVTRTLWGDLLMKENRPQDAVYQYVAAVELDRENPAIRDTLARIYVALGRPDAARQQWQEALRLDPTTRAYADSLRGLDKDGGGG
jgi:tetratricopeptide (TPR) repeat protein